MIRHKNANVCLISFINYVRCIYQNGIYIFFGIYMSKVKPFILDPVDSLASHDATNCDEIKVFCSSFTLARIPT